MNYKSRKASLFKRIAALIIDLFDMALIGIVLALFVPGLPKGLIQILLGLYFVCKDTVGGQSVGKRVLKIYVKAGTNFDQTPNLQMLILRNLSALVWYVDVALVIFNGENRKLGDLLVGTKVVTMEPVAGGAAAEYAVPQPSEPTEQVFNEPTYDATSYDANSALDIDMSKWDSLKEDLNFNAPVSQDAAHDHVKIAKKKKINYERDYIKENDWE